MPWLHEAGFSSVFATHDGGTLARRLYRCLPGHRRPADMPELDTMLEPLVGIGVEMAAPIELDPMITAVK